MTDKARDEITITAIAVAPLPEQAQVEAHLAALEQHCECLRLQLEHWARSRNPDRLENAQLALLPTDWADRHLTATRRFLAMLDRPPVTLSHGREEHCDRVRAAAEQRRQAAHIIQVCEDSLAAAGFCLALAEKRLRAGEHRHERHCPQAPRATRLTPTDIVL